MAKLDIDIVLLDESVVMYGFRALMSGAELEQFIKNPVMLYMHARAEGGMLKPLETDVVLPIGMWYDIRVEGHQLLAKPDFDDEDEFAQRIQKKVQKGYLKGASVWIDPIAVSDEAELMLPGQVAATFTKWCVYEASIVDIPNCHGALAIRNSAGKKVTLSGANNTEMIDYINTLIPQNTNMDKKLMAIKLGLSENATDQEISTKLAAVLAEANKVTGLNAEITQLKDDKLDAETKLTALQKTTNEEKINNLVDGAITAKKLAAGDKDKYVKLANADFATTKELIDAMKPFESLEGRLSGGGDSNGHSGEVGELMKLSGRELYLQGKLERLKQLSLPDFKVKYKEYYNVEYKG